MKPTLTPGRERKARQAKERKCKERHDMSAHLVWWLWWRRSICVKLPLPLAPGGSEEDDALGMHLVGGVRRARSGLKEKAR